MGHWYAENTAKVNSGNQVCSEWLPVAIILLDLTAVEPDITNLSISGNPSTVLLIIQAQNARVVDFCSLLFLISTWSLLYTYCFPCFSLFNTSSWPAIIYQVLIKTHLD
jgi:hypothetical protein